MRYLLRLVRHGHRGAARIRAGLLRTLYGDALSLGRRVGMRSGVTIEISEHGRIEICDDVELMEGAHLVAKRHGVLRLESGVFVGRNVQIVATSRVGVGCHTYIATGACVYDYDHGFSSEADQILSTPVSIGSRCWLGAHAVVTRGTVVGDDVTIAANAVARGTLEGGRVYGGVPARVLLSTRGTSQIGVDEDA